MRAGVKYFARLHPQWWKIASFSCLFRNEGTSLRRITLHCVLVRRICRVRLLGIVVLTGSRVRAAPVTPDHMIPPEPEADRPVVPPPLTATSPSPFAPSPPGYRRHPRSTEPDALRSRLFCVDYHCTSSSPPQAAAVTRRLLNTPRGGNRSGPPTAA